MPQRPAAVAAWHEIVVSKDPSLLDALLADDVVFRSPAVFAAQEGRDLTTLYLTCAMTVLGPTLQYLHEWYSDDSAVLEFQADLDGTLVHGVDMLRWNADDRLTGFTVMVRPMRGLTALIDRMARELAAAQA
jgi:hypothetical protein